MGSPVPTAPEVLSDSNRDPLEISLDDDIWQVRGLVYTLPPIRARSYSSQLKEEEDDDMDPELKAQQDREVEEFRRRLEQINNTVRLPLGQTSAIALSLSFLHRLSNLFRADDTAAAHAPPIHAISRSFGHGRHTQRLMLRNVEVSVPSSMYVRL